MAKKQNSQKNKQSKNLDTEGRKLLFRTLWALHGYNAFPKQLREEYIEQLWDINPDSKQLLRKNWLLSNIVDTEEILKKVLVYDANLFHFEKFVVRFDQLSPKAIRLVKTPPLSDNDREKLQAFPDKKHSIVSIG